MQTLHIYAGILKCSCLCLTDHCLSHKTAVAAGAISQYLRFMIDPGPDDYRRSVSLTGYNLLLEEAPSMWSNRMEHDRLKKRSQQDNVVIQRQMENDDDEDEGDAGEADDNYGEDDDGYDDDDEDYVVDNLHQHPVHPLFKHDNNGINIGADANERDEEYEQYIEDDDEEGEQGAGDKPPLEPIGDLDAQQNDPFNLENHHRDEDDGYNYYDNEEEENRIMQARLGHFDERKLEQLAPISRDIGGAAVPREGVTASNLESSLGRIYLFIFLTMIAFLLLLYRFIKRRKVVIRYYHR